LITLASGERIVMARSPLDGSDPVVKDIDIGIEAADYGAVQVGTFSDQVSSNLPFQPVPQFDECLKLRVLPLQPYQPNNWVRLPLEGYQGTNGRLELEAGMRLFAEDTGCPGVFQGAGPEGEDLRLDYYYDLKLDYIPKAGGNPVLMAGGEIYTALDRGAIDATEWVGPYHDMRLGLNRAARYYYYPGWHEPGTELEFIVNADAWAQLPEDLKTIVQTAAQATTQWIFSAMEARNAEALQKLETSQKVQILEFPPAVLNELKKVTKQTLDKEAAKDPEFKRIYDAYRNFRDTYADWNRIEVESANWYMKK